MSNVDELYNMSDRACINIGLICDIDPPTGTVRVQFDADDDDADTPTSLVSDWLPILVRKAQNDKETFPFDVGEQVCCLMDEFGDTGVCLGALYNSVDAPDGAGDDIYRILYKDGSFEQFDRSAGNKSIFYKGIYDAKTNAGAEHRMQSKHTIKNTAENLATIASDLMDAINAMTFTNGAGTTGPPNNLATFNLIKTRLSNLFV